MSDLDAYLAWMLQNFPKEGDQTSSYSSFNTQGTYTPNSWANQPYFDQKTITLPPSQYHFHDEEERKQLLTALKERHPQQPQRQYKVYYRDANYNPIF